MQRKSLTVFHVAIWIVVQYCVWACVGCVGSIVVGEIGAIVHGAPMELSRLAGLFYEDYGYALTHSTMSQLTLLNHGLAETPTIRDASNYSLPLINAQLQEALWNKAMPFISVAILGLKLALVRAYLFYHWAALFFLLGFVGLVDGLVQREIRKNNAGRESAFLYHNSKPLIHFCLISGVLVAFVLPLPIQTMEWGVATSAGLFGVAVQITTKRFKKHW